MTIVIDRRGIKSSKNASNRERFVKRYKRHLKNRLDDIMKDKTIEDAGKPVSVPIDWDCNEDDIGFDSDSGYSERVLPGNEDFKKGDLVEKPEDGEGGSPSNGGEEGEDEFLFTLTKEEFFDIYFHDLELPDFVKESMLDCSKMIYKRAGFVKDGVPTRLDVLKTIQQSIARRLSCRDKDKKPPFLDDVDLRYKHFVNRPQPMLKAVMFCCMDVSGSMEKHHKDLSKRFFILLYLFLTKNYESVELRFVRYHHVAYDVDEYDFFYSPDTGGTEVTTGLALIKEIIEKDYPTNLYNIYIAHTSDGDVGFHDDNIASYLDANIMDLIQYYAYVQVQSADQYGHFKKGFLKLYGELQKSQHVGGKLNLETATAAVDIFPVLANLFKRK